MRVLGLDVGEKRIGLAFGDTGTAVAVPVGVIDRVGISQDMDAVMGQATSRAVDLLVVGMPWSVSGRAGPQAQLVARFVDLLRQRASMPVATWDERFTSVEADRRLREARDQSHPGRKRGGSRLPRGAQDAMAAAVILQAYLDAHGAIPHRSGAGS